MTQDAVRKLKLGDEIFVGPFRGDVTCVDLADDDKIVVKWDCAESEDVLSDRSPIWAHVSQS